MKLNLILLFFMSISIQGYCQSSQEKKYSLQIDTLRLSKKQYQDFTKVRSNLDYIFDNFFDRFFNRKHNQKNQSLKFSN